MDQPYSTIVDFWTSFKPIVPYTPSPDSYHHKSDAVAEYPDYFDNETFDDNVTNGSGSTCYYKQDYPFSWEPQSQKPSCSYVLTDDGPLDQNKNSYCVLTSENVPQFDVCGSVAQEVIVHTVDPCTFKQQPKQNTCYDSIAKVGCFSKLDELVKIKQEYPKSPEQDHPKCVQQGNQEAVKQEIIDSVKQELSECQNVTKAFSKLPRKKRARNWNPTAIYTCSLCARTFNCKSGFTQHNNAHHSGPMEHRCHTCGKRYKLSEDLEQHQRRHEEDHKSVVCWYCPKKFNYKFDMMRHVKARHTEAPHKCPCCGKRFVRLDHLQLHEDKHRRKSTTAAANQADVKIECETKEEDV